MTTSPMPKASRWRRLRWILGICAVVVLVALSAVIIWLSDALKPDKEPPMSSDHVTAMENDLRAKGSAEEALTRYEDALAQTADQITALVPGLTWRWYYEDTTVSCTGPLADTNAVQVLTRHVVFDGPIPDAVWPQALDKVRSEAAALGANEVFAFVDQSGNHDVAISGANGVEVRFGTRVAANLSARSDCYLKQTDL